MSENLPSSPKTLWPKTADWVVQNRKYLTIAITFLLLMTLTLAYWLNVRGKEGVETIVISSGSKGAGYERIAQVLATHIAEQLPESIVQVLPSDGSIENLERIAGGQAQLGLVQNDIEGQAEIRVLSPLHEEVLHLFVTKNSQIQKLPDLKGKRVAVGPERGGTAKLMTSLFELYGLIGEVELVYEPIDQAMVELSEGTLHVCAMVTALGTPICRDYLSSGKLRLMGISEPGLEGSVVDGFRLHYPFVHPATIPRGSYANETAEMLEPLEPLGTIGVRSVLVCRADLPDEATRKITEAVIQARPKLIEMGFPEMADSRASFGTSYRYPFHPTVMRYLRRDPTFLEQYAESMGFVLSVMLALGGVIASFRQWMNQVKKDRIDEFYLELDEIQDRLVQKRSTQAELEEILSQLLASRHRAVGALVRENVIANESFLIFQSLLTESIREVERQMSCIGENVEKQ
ncbi:MAG: TAXI family TRAP transporter solute-binding subunit [Verrucomicrobiota bacterium]